MKMNTLCYETKVPTIYNKGTKFESQCNTFLLCYLNGYNDEQAQQVCDELNEKRPNKWHGIEIDWSNIDHLFVNKQEEMY